MVDPGKIRRPEFRIEDARRLCYGGEGAIRVRTVAVSWR
jgi:hypothetical protein